MGCTRTPMAMPLNSGMPAACRLCTARSVNMLLQTLSTAASKALRSFGSTPKTESCKPAPETPSRSSLFAEERTAMRSVPAGSFATRSSRTFAGTLQASTASRVAWARSATLGECESRAVCSAATAASTAVPATERVMTPNGTAKPFGALKPAVSAMDSRRPEEAAFEPATCGEVANSTASMRPCASTLSCPSFGAALPLACAAVAAEPPDFALAAAAASARAASLIFSMRTSPNAATSSFAGAPSAPEEKSESKSGRSVVQPNTAPSCRALRARWLSTGRSRATMTPRTRVGNSSSPLASSQNTMAPSLGSFFSQVSLSSRHRMTLPQAEPAEMAVHSGSFADFFASCMTSWTNFDTWKSTEVRISASTKTETAWPSMLRAPPSAGTER
mmetsp:Transcript_83772/g.241898  ORF Transcript_83772/g.241898 Transcript_83772/m.241898 type:complete len:390 (+) Transcript_83772:544-1713(+)